MRRVCRGQASVGRFCFAMVLQAENDRSKSEFATSGERLMFARRSGGFV
jgi:hypothetical protein